MCSRSDDLEIFHPKRYEISRAGDDIARWEEPRKTLWTGRHRSSTSQRKEQSNGRSGVDGDQVEAGWSVGRSTGLGEVKSGR